MKFVRAISLCFWKLTRAIYPKLPENNMQLMVNYTLHEIICNTVSETQDFCVSDFATVSEEWTPRSKIVLLFNTNKRTLRSKILGILQTE